MKDQQNYTSPTGAVRAAAHSEQVRYDLLLSNDVAMRRLAETFAEGFKKYGPDNWKRGFPVSELWAHAFIHLIKWIAGDKTEDHLAHACWNFMAIMWQEENKPELQDFPLRPEFCNVAKPTTEVVGHFADPEHLACPLYVGTPQEGTTFHDHYRYNSTGNGRCMNCGSPKQLHRGFKVGS